MATQASDSIKQKPRATTADELAVIAQRAQAFTNASGAAIAIGEGTTDEIVCRARSGASAPDVGTALRVEGTFTGVCIQSGKELRCDDAETDTRVDTAAIRALGIRSMVVTPIKEEGKVVGVLAVFASTPHAFTITHVAVLKTMADQIGGLLQRERRTKDEPHAEAPPVVVSKPPAPAKPVPRPVVIRPSTAQPLAANVAAAPARSNASPVSNVETMRPVPIAVEVAPPVVVPKKEKKHEPKPESQPLPRTNLGTLEAVASEPPKVTASKLVLGGLVAVLVVGGSIWGFVKMHKSASAATIQTVQPTQNASASSQPTVSATPVAAVTTPPSAPATTVTRVPANNKSAASEKPERRTNDQERNKPSPTPAPATVALAGGPSKIAAGTPQDQGPTVAPSLSVGGSSEIGSLARPVTSSTPAMLAQSDLVSAKAVRMVPAVYPEIAKLRRISGAVVVRITVGRDGKVTNPRLMSGPAVFQDAAFDAVRQWVFKPATLNGQPIEQDTEIRVNFHPN